MALAEADPFNPEVQVGAGLACSALPRWAQNNVLALRSPGACPLRLPLLPPTASSPRAPLAWLLSPSVCRHRDSNSNARLLPIVAAPPDGGCRAEERWLCLPLGLVHI